MFQLNEVKLGEIVEEISMGPFGSDIKTDNYVPSGVPIIRGGNLTSGRFNPDAGFVYLTKEKADSLGKANAYPDDILITHRGTLGQVGIIPRGEYDRYVVSQSLLRLKLKTKQANPFYIYYFLKSPAGQYRILANTSQTGVPAISQPVTSIRAIPIPLPPLPVQQRIADILGTLDDKIELNRRMNATLEAMARALFKSWFVDFDPVHAKAAGQPTGLPAHIDALFPSAFVDSPLGQIPQGWGVGKVGDVANQVRENRNPSDIPPQTAYIALEHMPKKSISLYEWSISDNIESNKSAFRRDDILFGKLRPYFHKVGIAPVNGVCSTDILVIRPKMAKYYGFTVMHLSSDAMILHCTQSSDGTKMPRTNWSDIANYDIVLPTSQIMTEFNNIFVSFAKQIQSNIHQIMPLTTLRDTLLPRLLSGEVEV